MVNAYFNLAAFAQLARNMPGVLKLQAIWPSGCDGDDATIAVQGIELLVDDFVGRSLQAHVAELTRLQTSRATPSRMKYSPVPVPETAQDWFEA